MPDPVCTIIAMRARATLRSIKTTPAQPKTLTVHATPRPP